MTIRKLILSGIFLLFTASLSAQNPESYLVFLKNGTYLCGKIISIDPEDSAKLVLKKRDTLSIKMTDIRRITRDTCCCMEGSATDYGVKEWGYTCIPEVSYGIGKSEGVDRNLDLSRDEYSIMHSCFNGFTLTPYIQLGVGVGLDAWRDRVFLPFYLDLRSNLLRKNNSPFFYFHSGYAYGWLVSEIHGNFGGAYVGIGAGGKFRINSKMIIVMSAGWRFQQLRQPQELNGVATKATIDANFLSVRIGFLF